MVSAVRTPHGLHTSDAVAEQSALSAVESLGPA